MHRELLDALSVITEEEQRILDEQRGIDPQLYTEKKELIVDSEKLLKKGKLIQVRPHTRFVNFPKHKHNYVEVIYMCQGTTTHILNGSKVILEAGDLLFLNQNAEQEILPAGEQDIAVNFIVLPEFFDTAFSMMDHMDRMETGTAAFDRELTGAVLNYIEEHYKNGSLSELAEIMGYDMYWLSREIKKRTGKTYKELLQSRRMRQAAYLLKNSRLSVADIIESVGYDNTSYFFRKFKECYGVSPKGYRDM